ncbi:MAG: hypothetical protein DRP16_05245 [Candidatus Aenigmatarchaeota archaeon]|nr:MAG: hypothetical protein DRP16_05245 [Candidatus Aenigmarchaeota archaeon]
MKALSTTILIVVSAVVILVAALVVLTIFGGGKSQITTLTQARNMCILAAKQSCETTGGLPITWSIATMNVEGKGMTTCSGLVKCHCDEAGNAVCSDK